MSNSQTLQLYLDLTQTQGSQDGRFATNTPPAHPSKVWIDQSNNSSADHILSVSFAAQVNIGIQVTINLPMGSNYRVDGNGNCLRVTVTVGRNKHKTSGAVYESPFTIENVAPANRGVVCTVFDQWYTPSQLTANNPNSATLSFGTPQYFSGNGTDKYAFIVAVTLYTTDSTGTKTYTAGHDPEMEVGM